MAADDENPFLLKMLEAKMDSNAAVRSSSQLMAAVQEKLLKHQE